MDVEGVNQAAEEEDWELVSAEGGLPTGHFEEEGFKNVPQDWDEIFEETWEIGVSFRKLREGSMRKDRRSSMMKRLLPWTRRWTRWRYSDSWG